MYPSRMIRPATRPGDPGRNSPSRGPWAEPSESRARVGFVSAFVPHPSNGSHDRSHEDRLSGLPDTPAIQAGGAGLPGVLLGVRMPVLSRHLRPAQLPEMPPGFEDPRGLSGPSRPLHPL